MTSVRFIYEGETLKGFSLKGHSSNDCDDDLGRTVCAAVSSAAYMTANTVTDIFGDKADIKVDDALMDLYVKNPSESTVKLLCGFKAHMEQLACQYSNKVRIYSEV